MAGAGSGNGASRRSPSHAGQGDDSMSKSSAIAQHAAHGRQLHVGHFAFMRAILQGLDTRSSWDRYLRIEGEHDGIRHINRTIDWIRDAFAAAAKRHARHGIARLVRIDARRLPDRKTSLPTLDEFAQAHGLQDFAEHEQIEQYQARYGAAVRASRRGRLIARQLDALDWLERLVAQPPGSADPVAFWLHPGLAAHLERAGIFTIRQLVDRINGLGLRWWSTVRAIGAGKAGRIVDWLNTHEATIGLSIGAHVNVKRSQLGRPDLQRVVPYATAIVPIEKFIMPAELDGSAGQHRATQRLCLIDAQNDCEALLVWIEAKRGLSEEQKAEIKRKQGIDPAAAETKMERLRYLSHTQRAYLKEAERFMLWAIVQHKKPLSSMEPDDCESYRSFLANPAPTERWCGPRGRERWSPLWRPFEGPLSPRAQQHAITILKNLYKFLVDQRYLVRNPWNDVAMLNVRIPADKGRSFTPVQWRFIEEQLGLLAETSANRRLCFTLHLLYATGLRLSEAVAARVDHLNRATCPDAGRTGQPVERWQLKVTGARGTERLVPVPPDVISELLNYLSSRGLDPDPVHPANRGAYLLGKAVDVLERAPWSPEAILRAEPKEGITAGRLYKVLKGFFAGCAKALARTDVQGGERLADASAQWLRNTHGALSR
ncbi:MAG: int, tyrosine-based site-specific recombinase [Burkholderia sp.]|nr:int, tyrosine-based site-specific recombinase [Burkholderia sp.]